MLNKAFNYPQICVPSKSDLYPQMLNPRGTCTPISKCEWECCTRFGVNWLLGSGKEAKNRFSRWLPWRPSWISDGHDFSYFWSTGHPDASYQVSSQLAQGCRRSRLLKQLLTPHDGHWLTTIAHHEHFMLRWAKNDHAGPTCVAELD